jgi:hypothetical protein
VLSVAKKNSIAIRNNAASNWNASSMARIGRELAQSPAGVRRAAVRDDDAH